ncbi:MAG: cyclic nucleotide-binding domain-containing protein [Magnetovibrionaceae bacterium]
MKIEHLDRLIGEHPFFEGFRAEFLDLLAGCARHVVYPAGDYIYRYGQEETNFYLIRHGAVALEVQAPGAEPLVVETLTDNDILGWSWMVPPHRARFDARARDLTRVISLDGACLRGKMAADHELGFLLYQRFVPVMADRLQAARLQMLDLYPTHNQKRSGAG